MSLHLSPPHTPEPTPDGTSTIEDRLDDLSEVGRDHSTRIESLTVALVEQGVLLVEIRDGIGEMNARGQAREERELDAISQARIAEAQRNTERLNRGAALSKFWKELFIALATPKGVGIILGLIGALSVAVSQLADGPMPRLTWDRPGPQVAIPVQVEVAPHVVALPRQEPPTPIQVEPITIAEPSPPE